MGSIPCHGIAVSILLGGLGKLLKLCPEPEEGELDGGVGGTISIDAEGARFRFGELNCLGFSSVED